LKQLLAEKTLEVDFFRGALQKVEARRQKSGETVEFLCRRRAIDRQEAVRPENRGRPKQ
jgi:hypothetical protein